MKTPFKCLLLMLITSATALAQRHQILDKSVALDKTVAVQLNIENIYLAIEESTDGSIHFDYAIEFEGYSKKAINEKLNGLKTDVVITDKQVTLDAKSLSQISFQSFVLTSDHGLYLEDDFGGIKTDTIFRKSQDALLKEIQKNNRTNWPKDALKFINGRFKKIDKDGNLSNIRKGNVDIMRSQFVIKIPPYVKLTIKSKNAGIYFRNDVENELSVNSKKGNFKAKALRNDLNTVSLENLHFEAEAITGGRYELKNVKNGKIGSFMEAKITSEFSKLEIGETGRHAIINDFNSEYWFYNWADNFEKALMTTEYSKINLFFPDEDSYQIGTYGHDTAHFYDGVTTEISPSRDNKSSKMMIIGEDSSPNKIQINTSHGIVRFGKNFIELKR